MPDMAHVAMGAPDVAHAGAAATRLRHRLGRGGRGSGAIGITRCRRHAGKQNQGSYRAQRSHRSLRITKGYALQNGESLPNVQLFLR